MMTILHAGPKVVVRILGETLTLAPCRSLPPTRDGPQDADARHDPRNAKGEHPQVRPGGCQARREHVVSRGNHSRLLVHGACPRPETKQNPHIISSVCDGAEEVHVPAPFVSACVRRFNPRLPDGTTGSDGEAACGGASSCGRGKGKGAKARFRDAATFKSPF